mmetsp:Transcript_57434/g.163093  ORF Transcript_57434/g.163093 Transcript_57434/m.163093 type:complete len:99 (+) Transcript_57434:1720-2016(+)
MIAHLRATGDVFRGESFPTTGASWLVTSSSASESIRSLARFESDEGSGCVAKLGADACEAGRLGSTGEFLREPLLAEGGMSSAPVLVSGSGGRWSLAL